MIVMLNAQLAHPMETVLAQIHVSVQIKRKVEVALQLAQPATLTSIPILTVYVRLTYYS